MKRISLYLFIILLCSLLLASCVNNDSNSSLISNILESGGGSEMYNNNCTLIVNGKNVTNDNYVHLNQEKKYAEIPLITVLENLDIQVEWKSQSIAHFFIGDKEYELNTTLGTLIEVGGSSNIFKIPPGAEHGLYYNGIGENFVIDSDSSAVVFYLLNAIVDINYETSTIIISNNLD